MIIVLSFVMAASLSNTETNEDGISALITKVEKTNHDLKEKDNSSFSQQFFINPSNFINTRNDLSEPFALYLTEKISSALKAKNYKIAALSQQSLALNGWEIEGQWRLRGTRANIKLVATLWNEGKKEKSFSIPYTIETEAAENKALHTPNDAHTWGRTIANKLRSEIDPGKAYRIHIVDFKTAGSTDVNLALNIAAWLQQFFDESNAFTVVTPYKELTEMSATTLQQRLDRRGNKKTPSLTTTLTDIELELHGKIQQSNDKILILTHLKRRNGSKSDTISVKFPKELLPKKLQQHTQKKQSTFNGKRPEKDIFKNGLKLELTSNRGEDKAIFNQYDTKRFFATANKNAYIYIFSLPQDDENSKHNAFLLYPTDAKPTFSTKRSLTMFDSKNIMGQNSASNLITKLNIVAIASEEEIKTPLDGITTIIEYRRFLRRALEKARRNNTGYAETKMSIAVMEQRN
ncbi:MAG: hypothetical protein GY804_07880 [Alphaproteobacteria bacterium]|nr:hypothetical protein [Alphaproteobacteria bacterium]